ncbi:sodium- and chloride-dependent transporter XTRP3A-like isoform X2 [Corythoichthys intestinalis]|nr:sodium- and chloride-dependent transporter XTRP3A-like isoform X2 [Corythoichthys intestinalis]
MEKDARPNWDSPLQFVLACVSYAVGLGNVWRFPYLCQMHGGGSFLIPYLLMLLIEGVPLFYMELAIGQKMRLGSIGAWSAVSPYLGGVGLASVVASIYICLYYNIINAWSFWYLFNSFQSVLPWSNCPVNANLTGPVEECQKASPTQYFFFRETLNIASSIEENGGIRTSQALCFLLAWVITYLFVIHGVKSSGKVVYFTATFPYVVLVIYLIRGLTLPGAINGIAYMFTPKLEELANPTAWINAATQIFYSLGLGFGSLIAFSSYNQYNNNFEYQAIIVSIINSGTSIFASIVTFSIYGFKATVNYENCLERTRILLLNTFNLAEDTINMDNVFEWVQKLNATYPEQIAELGNKLEECDLTSELDTAVEGVGLAFIVYSEAIQNMPLPQLWSVLYFFMLLLLGLGSMLGNLTAITTPLRDFKLFANVSNEVLNGTVCVILLLFGLGFTTPSGNYWFTMFNEYGASFSLLFVVLIEIITISYIYGLKRFEKDIEDMIGHRPN